MADVIVHPTGAFVEYEGVKYYRDGFLYGELLPDAEIVEEQPMPTLWSTIVIRYRQKPKDVDAIQLTQDNVSQVADWCGGVMVLEVDPEDDAIELWALNVPSIKAETGVARASDGDYVIRDEHNRFSVMSSGEFTNKYELA